THARGEDPRSPRTQKTKGRDRRVHSQRHGCQPKPTSEISKASETARRIYSYNRRYRSGYRMGPRLIARLRMILVDTNIIAPLYVWSARSQAAGELFTRDAIWRTEPLALIELSNVLLTYQRARYISAATARDCLNRAAAFLQPYLFRVSHQAALDVALRHGTTAYDARF